MAYAEEDRSNLLPLLEVMESDLQVLVLEEGAASFEGEEREHLQRAWDEASAAFHSISLELQDLRDDDWQAPRRLERAGLTGASLRLKRARYLSVSRAWRQAREAASHLRHVATKCVFRMLNVLLGSLAAVFGAAEAMKELKGTAEDGYLAGHGE